MASMQFDWREYFRLAENLAKGSDEAALRSAISRTYYYCYHLALQRAQANSYERIPGEPSHIQLWRQFSGNPEPVCQQLAEIGKRLKEKRERADYEGFYNRIQEAAPLLLEKARKFATLLGSLPARHPSPHSQRAGPNRVRLP